MEEIKIGIYSFNADILREKTIKEAKEMFAKIPPKIVDEAWKIANPKRSSKAKNKAE